MSSSASTERRLTNTPPATPSSPASCSWPEPAHASGPSFHACAAGAVRGPPGVRSQRPDQPLRGALALAADLGRGPLGVVVLWLALASYAAVAKHIETVEQGRELARLESVAKTLRTTVEESRTVEEAAPKAAAVPDLVAELADAKAARERALTLADARAGEAEELRHELALAHDQIRELTTEATQAQAVRGAAFQVAGVPAAPAGPDPKLALPGPQLPDPGCPAR